MALGLSTQVSADTLNCPSLTIKSDGTKVCAYKSSKSVDYAVKNYKKSAQNDDNFAVYDNNCTNFVSQSVLAGFAETKYRSTLYSKREQYLADENDTYSWFYRSKWDAGANWKQAHSLYLYAKYTDENDSGSNYNENGPKFDFVTRDSDSAYLDPNDVLEGDIIFADINNPTYDQYIDGTMDHVFIVTGKEWYQSFYNKIRVTSNSSYYTDKGLGEINEEYEQDIHFYVYRPVAYVEK
ncbi:MAG: amidase domain-containing protein [Patescibacteria group bacterium]|nr:amidase domain-containing protein [Patescibacteria group bacterium]